MKINLLNSILIFAGLFLIVFILGKLFGTVGIYAFFSLFIGCLIGDGLGFNRGKETGYRKANEDIVQEIEIKKSER